MTDAQSAGLVALADRMELWSIDRLRPYERNSRTHSETQVDQIAASLVEFGWTNPILLDENAGTLAGHGRLLAARKLGLAEVPVIRFEHLSRGTKAGRIFWPTTSSSYRRAGTMRCSPRSCVAAGRASTSGSPGSISRPDPKYVDTIIDRWQRFTGCRALHVESEEPFPRSAEEAHAAHLEVGGEGLADRDQADAA
ncbi:MAG TPA: ParB/Srx family N-terminal domain-containing protein [Geminicoccaceae bacterium]